MTDSYVSTANLVIDQRTLYHREHLEEDYNFVLSCFPGIPVAEWITGVVKGVGGVQMSARVTFAISRDVARDVFVWLSINTIIDNPGIKARDIMHEIWQHYKVSLEYLSTFAYLTILNDDVSAAMQNAKQALCVEDNSRSVPNQWLVVYPGGTGWAEADTNNPCILGVQKLLDENRDASGNAYIHRVEFIWQPYNENLILHLKIQLAR